MIDFDAVRKLKLEDGDLLVVPESTEHEDMRELAEALRLLAPGCKFVIVRGPLTQLDTCAMSSLGWHRA
ncbi:hypothetical protein [Pseudomonas sp. ME-P-057]|uniref:hypothetical protein n=1 Tax=Pseudomonas sp. ME-P-057 TaxID=3040321 RepID=UPI00255434DD|nr:hypothetical protein [Pseudomonas sp. ME-P-057]